ncbi:hypothetical protein DFJ64_0590 [Thermasporomyces composti]|jgi:hypothetical protein|uniref:Uncharacterized protein n=1 Tax=Thermasporomyces composti TaxID=696763 RepID=A0A3D9V0D3_THECX|nr:hypothetical protein DFJ64_0590 [Thermasporomyces composti]
MIVTLAVVTLAMVAVFDRHAPARPRPRHDHSVPSPSFPSQRPPADEEFRPLSGKSVGQSDQPG